MEAISLVQRGNLQSLERTLRRQWRLGQNIVLCWSPDEHGLLVIFVPHYFLGNYCAPGREDGASGADNERYVRDLISGRRQKQRQELFAVAERLGAAPTFIKLDHPLESAPPVFKAVEQLIRRYGISFVGRRAVLLFDITDFSLHTPFEQASQLNSLSYSMNSVYNKLAAQGLEVNFARTTTGDGYYVWNRDTGPEADRRLFEFFLLTLLDNQLARAASRGKTVPVIRAGFHVGSHYELYQAEGVNPSVISYIVGDVTIELARMLDAAVPGQVLVGDFAGAGTIGGEVAAVRGAADSDTRAFVDERDAGLGRIRGVRMMGREIDGLRCWLSSDDDGSPRIVTVEDKHGLSHRAYNLELAVDLEGEEHRLGHGAAAG